MSKVYYALELGDNGVSDAMTLQELIEILHVLEKPSMRDIIANGTISIIVSDD